MQTQYRVQTPESVEFTYELAGLGSRALAALIDHVLVTSLLLLMVLTGCIGSIITLLVFIPIGPLILLASFLTYFGYFAYFEWRWNGQTPGKRLLDLRVIDDRGLPLDSYQALVRNLLRPVDMLPVLLRVTDLAQLVPALQFLAIADYITLGTYGLGGLVAFLSPTGKRLGDWASTTLVVRTTRRVSPEAILPAAEKYNSIQENASLRARVRRTLSLEEKETLLQLCLRRNEFDVDYRQDLFADAAAHLESRLGFPREPFMSPEKFVQNITSVAMAEDQRGVALPPRENSAR